MVTVRLKSYRINLVANRMITLEAKWGFDSLYVAELLKLAHLAQLVEQRTRNAQVAGSIPAIGIDTTLGASQDELYQEKRSFLV